MSKFWFHKRNQSYFYYDAQNCLHLIYMQVTRSIDTSIGELSQQEQKTIEAIVRAR
jgi:hypothetical protein